MGYSTIISHLHVKSICLAVLNILYLFNIISTGTKWGEKSLFSSNLWQDWKRFVLLVHLICCYVLSDWILDAFIWQIKFSVWLGFEHCIVKARLFKVFLFTISIVERVGNLTIIIGNKWDLKYEEEGYQIVQTLTFSAMMHQLAWS